MNASAAFVMSCRCCRLQQTSHGEENCGDDSPIVRCTLLPREGRAANNIAKIPQHAVVKHTKILEMMLVQ